MTPHPPTCIFCRADLPHERAITPLEGEKLGVCIREGVLVIRTEMVSMATVLSEDVELINWMES